MMTLCTVLELGEPRSRECTVTVRGWCCYWCNLIKGEDAYRIAMTGFYDAGFASRWCSVGERDGG